MTGTAADPNATYSVRKVSLPDPLSGFDDDLARQSAPVVGFHVTGPCPGCGHSTIDVFPTAVLAMDSGTDDGGVKSLTPGFRSLRQRNQHPAAARQPSVAMQHCQCDANHDKSNGKDGCGAVWLIKATFDTTQPQPKVTLSAPTADEAATEWPGAQAMDVSNNSSLTTVQAAAVKWQQGLTAILGLIAIVSLIGGRSALEAIDFGAQVAIVALAAIAVLANAWAIYQCTLSSIGFPKIKNAAGTDYLIDYDLLPMRQTAHATNALRNGVFSAALSLAAALAATPGTLGV